jgi:hypothetical protein
MFKVDETLKRYDHYIQSSKVERAIIAYGIDINDKRKYVETIMILELDIKIDQLKKAKKKYIEQSRIRCSVCMEKDDRFCACHGINNELLFILLIYHKRCSRGIIKLPLIPKQVLLNEIYSNMRIILLEKLAEAIFIKRLMINMNIHTNDFHFDFLEIYCKKQKQLYQKQCEENKIYINSFFYCSSHKK